jgi:hypothetical protein
MAKNDPQEREVEREVEVVGDEVFDVTEAASLPHPGEDAPLEPIEEVLGVRMLTSTEAPADELDVPYEALDLAHPEDDGFREREDSDLEEALGRTVLQHDLEVRVERLDDEGVTLEALEPRVTGHQGGDILCTRCRLWKNPSQFVEAGRRVCRECS